MPHLPTSPATRRLPIAVLAALLLASAAPGIAQAQDPASPSAGQQGDASAAAPAASEASSGPAEPAESAATEGDNELAHPGEWLSTVSLIGRSKYPDGFTHYDYVNPDAPKGGMLNSIALGSYDSFNPYVVRGSAAAGLATVGGGLLYDTLFEQSPDEPSTAHHLVAEAMRYPADYSSATYRLDPDARFHDGETITTDDVIWSFTTLKELHPQWNAYYRNIVKAEETGEREVTFTFDETGNRELPQIVGDLPVLPRHYWEGTNANGETRDITQPTLEAPLGSGPYRIGEFRPGRSLEWVRVEDYWAADNPTRVGRYNYDLINYTYFRDQSASWEAFKKGGINDYRVENSSQQWAEGYDFPAANNGQVIKTTIPDGTVSSMQAYVLNTRLPKFQDRNVRKALTLVYNFQEMNRTLFYDLYKRQTSYFDNSELAATGLPSEEELELLEPLRDAVPPEVFTEEFQLPVYDEPADSRTFLREALTLLEQAGYTLRGTELVDAETGEQFTIEMLGSDPRDTRVLEPYARDLRRIGIGVEVRIVDSNQYVDRLRNFDFEMTGMKYYPQSLSPGNEQRDYFSTQAADTPGSRNYAGVKNEAVDALIDDIVYAKTREGVVAATRAMDRVLLWEYYVIPQWNKTEDWVAYWDKFGLPPGTPDYSGLDPFSWWTKAAEAETEASAN